VLQLSVLLMLPSVLQLAVLRLQRSVLRLMLPQALQRSMQPLSSPCTVLYQHIAAMMLLRPSVVQLVLLLPPSVVQLVLLLPPSTTPVSPVASMLLLLLPPSTNSLHPPTAPNQTAMFVELTIL
jgi:hypothetical protein